MTANIKHHIYLFVYLSGLMVAFILMITPIARMIISNMPNIETPDLSVFFIIYYIHPVIYLIYPAGSVIAHLLIKMKISFFLQYSIKTPVM